MQPVVPAFCMLQDVGQKLHWRMTGYLQSIELLQLKDFEA